MMKLSSGCCLHYAFRASSGWNGKHVTCLPCTQFLCGWPSTHRGTIGILCSWGIKNAMQEWSSEEHPWMCVLRAFPLLMHMLHRPSRRHLHKFNTCLRNTGSNIKLLGTLAKHSIKLGVRPGARGPSEHVQLYWLPAHGSALVKA